MPEDDLHEAVAALLHRIVLPPAEWTCFPAGNVPLPAQFAVKLHRMGLRRGWPDFLILHGRLHGLELKREGEGLSKDRLVRARRNGALRLVEGQASTFPRLAGAGMRIEVATSIDGVLAALRAWKIPVRKVAA
jgi:hypothetical protein